MKNIHHFYTYLLIIPIYFALSCNRITPEPIQANNQNLFTIKEGQAVFKSANDFKNQISLLSKMSLNELNNWNQNSSFISLFKNIQAKTPLNARQASATDTNYNSLEDIVNDKYFASILNKDGEFIIGNSQIRVTPEIVFIGDVSKYNEIHSKNPANYLHINPNNYIKENDIIIGRAGHLDATASGGRTALFNGIDHSIYDWDNTHRSATVIYNDNWFVYRSIGCKVKFQNKRWWGGWWQANTDALHLDYDVVYDVSTFPGIQTFRHVFVDSRDCQDCPELNNTIDWSTLSLGIADGGFSADLIDSPFDFSYFIANSTVVWSGMYHYDNLRQDQ
nr:hypothetical protein [uncultured Arsenicibacter sp.]